MNHERPHAYDEMPLQRVVPMKDLMDTFQLISNPQTQHVIDREDSQTETELATKTVKIVMSWIAAHADIPDHRTAFSARFVPKTAQTVPITSITRAGDPPVYAIVPDGDSPFVIRRSGITMIQPNELTQQNMEVAALSADVDTIIPCMQLTLESTSHILVHTLRSPKK